MRSLYVLAALVLCAAVASANNKESAQVLNRPLQPRTEAPFWTGIAVKPDGTFKQISSDDYRGKYTVLLFYPFDFTYVCPTEIISFSDAYSRFEKLNARVVAVSVDSHFSHLAWTKTPRNQGGVGKLDIPLVADVSKEISRSFGVLVENPNDELYGADLRGLYIIDDKGKIRSVTINDAPVGRSVEETLRLIEAFQFTDKNGEVCPEGWKPGAKTIVPDQEKKLKYFQDL